MGIYHFKTASSKIKGKNRLSSVTGFKHVVSGTLPLFSPSFPVALSLKRLVSVPETAFVHCRLTRVNKSAHYGEQLRSL